MDDKTIQQVQKNVEALGRIERELGEVKITAQKLYELLAGKINGKRQKGLFERVEDLESKSKPASMWKNLSLIQKLGVVAAVVALLGNNIFEVVSKAINIIHPIIDQLAK